MNIFIC